MSVTATQVGKLQLDRESFNKVTHDILANIDDRIRAYSGGLGRAVIDYPLPVAFTQLTGLNKSTVQLLVYTSVARSLLQRGFEVRMVFKENDDNHLYIAWETYIPDEEVDAMRKFLRGLMIPPAELQDFILGKLRGHPPARAAPPPPAPPAGPPAGPPAPPKADIAEARRAEKDLLNAS
jgi:hypothetical protein